MHLRIAAGLSSLTFLFSACSSRFSSQCDERAQPRKRSTSVAKSGGASCIG